MVEELRKKLIEANEFYRKGISVISDMVYDSMVDKLKELSPNDEFFNSIGVKIDDDRKSKLPITMASMNKLKSIQDIHNWIRLKNINNGVQFILMPKYDGLSLGVEEIPDNERAWTRGDGVIGQKSDDHYKLISNKLKYDNGHESVFRYTNGEVIMPKKVFNELYSNEFANPRNLVSGLLNSKEPSDSLSDCVYIRYGGVGGNFSWKSDLLDELNGGQQVKVEYVLTTIDDITEEYLQELFDKWSENFEIDGIIIEVNHIGLQEDLGRETSTNNPVYARAYKSPKFEQLEKTKVINIEYNVSKRGLLKPVSILEPVKLDGVIVRRCTLNNARFVKNMGIGIGSEVYIKRSGMVIPQIVDVVNTIDFDYPAFFEDSEVLWDENNVDLITKTETNSQKIKKIISFFEILKAKDIGEGIVNILWNNGYNTIHSILNIQASDLEVIDGFGSKKAEKIYNSIQSCIKSVPLSTLQHASSIFKNLGSKKLALLEHFESKPSIEDILMIEGFAEVSAKNYIDGYDDFNEFIKNLPIVVEKKKSIEKIGNDLENKQFTFTGIRRPDIEEVIISRGGKIASSISSKNTHLIMKQKGSGSSKEKKAIELGIEILDINELETLLNN